MCIIFSLTTEFRQCFRQFFSQWFTCLFELEGISPNHTLLLNPWYDLNYQRRIVRWSSLVEFTETLIGMQWVHGSYSKTVEGSDFRWPLSSISMHSIKSRPRSSPRITLRRHFSRAMEGLIRKCRWITIGGKLESSWANFSPTLFSTAWLGSRGSESFQSSAKTISSSCCKR